jgi:hypothetical protein
VEKGVGALLYVMNQHKSLWPVLEAWDMFAMHSK